jgi:hypothetical protein
MDRKREIDEYLRRLDEPALRALLVDFFNAKVGEAYEIHGTAEHGIDIAVKVPEYKDHIRKVFHLVVQVKCGDLNSMRWRNDVLGQLLEASYYPIRHPAFTEQAPRRVLLVITGSLEQEVRQAIIEYNARHYLKLEVYELINLINLLDDHSYYDFLAPPIIGEAAAQPIEIKEFGATA